MIDLCHPDPDSNQSVKQPELASVVTTNIPYKLSISSYKLKDTKNGLLGKWYVDRSFDLNNLVEWVN